MNRVNVNLNKNTNKLMREPEIQGLLSLEPKRVETNYGPWTVYGLFTNDTITFLLSKDTSEGFFLTTKV